MKKTSIPTNAACALYDKERCDFVPVGGQVLFHSPEPLEDYLSSGSEWINPDNLIIVDMKLFTDVYIRVPEVAADDMDATEIPEDL